MPDRQRVFLFFAILSLMVVLLAYSCVWADPVIDFIVRADSLAQEGGDELLITFVVDNSILVGAAVGQLLDVAIEVGDGGNKDGEAENIDFAERLGRIYQEQTGSSTPLELVTNYKDWKSSERAQRRKAKEFEQQATEARGAGELDRAVELHTKALDIYREIGDWRSEAVTLGSLGVVHWYRGDMEQVIESYQKALAARRAIEDRILEGKTLNGLGSANLMTGNNEAAVEFYTKAVSLREKTGDVGGLGTSLSYLGNVYVRLRRLVDARESFERAFVVLERSGNPVQMVDVLTNIANLYTETGQLSRANEVYHKALEICKTADVKRNEAYCRLNLADNLRMMKRYNEALAQLEEASTLLETFDDPEATVIFYQYRGLVYLRMNELDRARDDLVMCYERAGELDTPRYAIQALINIGYLYRYLGAFEQGLSSAEKAMGLAEEAQDHSLLRDAIALAAQFNELMGRYEKSLEYWHWVLERDELDGLEGHVLADKISIYSKYAALGRVDEARAGFREIYPDVREIGQDELEYSLHLGLGHSFEKDNPDSAVFHYERALEIIEEARRTIGGTEIRAGYLAGERRRFYEEVARYYVSLREAGDDGVWSRRAFRTIERAKARGLLDLLEASVLLESTHAEDAVLDSLYRLDPGSSTYTEEERRLKDRYIAVRTGRLDRTLKPLATGEIIVDISDIQRALPKETALFEYALGDTASFLWVIDRKGHDLFELPDRRTLRLEVERLRDAVSRPGPGDAVLRKTARNLYETLIMPAEGRLKKIKRLIIIPDGTLFEIPFELLLTDEPRENVGWEELPYLVRSYATLYVPSASVYLKLLQAKDKKKYPMDLFAMGDPDFSLIKRNSPIRAASLSQLPHTRLEIEHISAHVKEKQRRVYLGAEANEYRLKKELERTRPRIVHLATHGLVDPVEPVSSSVVLCPDQKQREDGFLYTLEILSSPFDVGLVVVSACESAAGRISRSEGVVGLSRAFLAAGADGVVASLWAVSDESTAALMGKLYERMVGKKKPAAESLKHARLALIEDPRYAHPFFWSAFIVIGNEKAPW